MSIFKSKGGIPMKAELRTGSETFEYNGNTIYFGIVLPPFRRDEFERLTEDLLAKRDAAINKSASVNAAAVSQAKITMESEVATSTAAYDTGLRALFLEFARPSTPEEEAKTMKLDAELTIPKLADVLDLKKKQAIG